MNELPNPDLVVFKNVLRKNKIESDIGDIIVKKICLLGNDLKNISLMLNFYFTFVI